MNTPGRLAKLLAGPMVAGVWLYRVTLSPFFGGQCRFSPSCSQYAIEALRQHGAFRGSRLALRRLSRCHPLSRGDVYDPVPPAESHAEGKA